jgi:hypothetical protein
VMDGIDTETVNSTIQPKPEGVEHGLANLRISPVQIGLLL